MREGSSKRLGTTLRLQDSKVEAKSFFCNILPVSHYVSIFCGLSPYQMAAKALKADILAEPYQKNIAIYPADSLSTSEATQLRAPHSRQLSRLHAV